MNISMMIGLGLWVDEGRLCPLGRKARSKRKPFVNSAQVVPCSRYQNRELRILREGIAGESLFSIRTFYKSPYGQSVSSVEGSKYPLPSQLALRASIHFPIKRIVQEGEPLNGVYNTRERSNPVQPQWRALLRLSVLEERSKGKEKWGSSLTWLGG